MMERWRWTAAGMVPVNEVDEATVSYVRSYDAEPNRTDLSALSDSLRESLRREGELRERERWRTMARAMSEGAEARRDAEVEAGLSEVGLQWSPNRERVPDSERAFARRASERGQYLAD